MDENPYSMMSLFEMMAGSYQESQKKSERLTAIEVVEQSEAEFLGSCVARQNLATRTSFFADSRLGYLQKYQIECHDVSEKNT